jgi:hypothetical protein
MTANRPLNIHEFSTGINPDGTSENWISRGFTGQYMNSTLPEIPYNVERSIANDEFTVAESAVKDNPSMVGRVVLASGGASEWSVVAVITRGKDEYVRSLTVSRYFLAEGSDSLSKIVAWINFQARQGRLLVFNPFELKTVGKPNISTAPIVKVKEDGAWLRNSPTPLIIPSEQATKYPFTVVDGFACQKAQMTGQPASWAYNVEALEKPERFQIILPASDRASALIQQALATKPKDQAASAIDEKALKQAIKGLADNPTVKADQWQTFVENIFVVASAFPDPDKASDYWRRLFDGQGASNAIKQGIYTQPMIRLLTLRAIALPETLPDFLQWLQVDTGKKSKAGSYSETSLEFQAQLSGLSQEPRLKEFLIEGVRDLVRKVLTKVVSPESVVWLLLSKTSLWGQFKSLIRNDFRHDLEVLGNLVSGTPSKERFVFSGKFWDKIWKEIEQYWRVSPRSFSEKYIPLADFFDQLGDSFVSAHFCQLSYGQVPSELFKQAFPRSQNTGLINSHGLMIRQQGYNEIGEPNIVPYPLVAAIAVLMLSIGLSGGFFLGARQQHQSSTQSQEQQNTQNQQPSDTQDKLGNSLNPATSPPSSNPKLSAQIPKDFLELGLQKFDEPSKTKESLQNIYNFLSTNNVGISKSTIKDKIKKVISGGEDYNLQLCVIDGNCDPQRKSEFVKHWVTAIYFYQTKSKKKLTADGVINVSTNSNDDNDTYKQVYKDVEEQLKASPSQLRVPEG